MSGTTFVKTHPPNPPKNFFIFINFQFFHWVGWYFSIVFALVPFRYNRSSFRRKRGCSRDMKKYLISGIDDLSMEKRYSLWSPNMQKETAAVSPSILCHLLNFEFPKKKVFCWSPTRRKVSSSLLQGYSVNIERRLVGLKVVYTRYDQKRYIRFIHILSMML